MRNEVYLRFSPRRSAKRASPLCSRWQRRFARPRPRATATLIAHEDTVQCVVSAATATAGLRSCQKTLPTAWASATAGSAHKASITVPTVFRCVASRNRERTLGTRRLVLTRPSSSAPNFLCRVGRRGRTPKSTDEPKRSRVNYFGSRSAVVTFWPVGRWNRRSPNSGRQPITCSVTERFTVSKTYSFSVFFVKA